jgi:hypothetical protein
MCWKMFQEATLKCGCLKKKLCLFYGVSLNLLLTLINQLYNKLFFPHLTSMLWFLFNYTISSLDYIMSNNGILNELEIKW